LPNPNPTWHPWAIVSLCEQGSEIWFPLAIQAAQLLQLNGCDPITATAGFVKRDINRMLPIIYSTWAKKAIYRLGERQGNHQAQVGPLFMPKTTSRPAFDRRVGVDAGSEWENHRHRPE
jgi:hypothetical protein